MPSYDDDDVIDYENELPDFEEEADLDDYLNDEEYELMNEILPQARKEMTDYQGWDNFALKREILETNFDLPEALKQLKRAFKKKKASEGMYIKALQLASHSSLLINLWALQLTARMRIVWDSDWVHVLTPFSGPTTTLPWCVQVRTVGEG